MAKLLEFDGTEICTLSDVRFTGPITSQGTDFTAVPVDLGGPSVPTDRQLILEDDSGGRSEVRVMGSRVFGGSSIESNTIWGVATAL